ncbi:MAG: hypothetical protein V3T84_06455 [Phycisphaerales bacterium]
MSNDIGSPTDLPAGYRALPIDTFQEHAAMRVCVLVRAVAENGCGNLVVVRNLLTSRAYLGCIVDHGGVIHDWVEIRVQDPDCLGASPEAVRIRLSNTIIDRRWVQESRALAEIEPRQLLRTGFEEQHPLPTFIDLGEWEVFHPKEPESGFVFRLCEDDSLLLGHGLPPYSASLHRYLYISEFGKDTPFVPVTRDAPTSPSTRPLQEVTNDDRRGVPFNPRCGLLLVRRYSPVRLETYVDILGGGSWSGVFHGENELDLGGPLRALSQRTMHQRLADGHLHVAGRGSSVRVLEVLHLKLRLLVDLVTSVREFVSRTQEPLLNLRADSFQIQLGDPAVGLPFLWTTTVRLADPGHAVPLPVEGSDLQYYLRGDEGTSIYWPESGKSTFRQRASIRIRQVIEEADGRIVVDGTLYTDEPIQLAHSDLLWFRVQLDRDSADLYAHAVGDRAIAEGELRFRTVPQDVGEDRQSALRSLEGIPMDDIPFEVVPFLSTPFDMFSLGVLAVQSLLVDTQQRLPVALDEVLSLARQVAHEFDEQSPLPGRVERIVSKEPKWLEQLGPHRLVREELGLVEALDLVPPQLWYQTLALIVQMFPGIGPDSLCRDLGDAPAGGLHKVFDPIVSELEDLLRRSRSLIVVDWAANREIHGVIRKYAVGLRKEQTQVPETA